MRLSASTTPAARSSGPSSSAPAIDMTTALRRIGGWARECLHLGPGGGPTTVAMHFSAKYDASGTLQWIRAVRHQRERLRASPYRRMGWAMSTFRERPMAVWEGPMPATRMRLSPSTTPAARFSGPGSLAPSELDRSYGVSADGLGNVYISGYHRWQPRWEPTPGERCVSQQVRRQRHAPVDSAAWH